MQSLQYEIYMWGVILKGSYNRPFLGMGNVKL